MTLPALLAGMLLPQSLRAQEAPGADSVLARLTAEAIAANPSLEASRAMARAATAKIRPAGALPDPMLSAGVMNLTLPRFAFRESDFTEVDVELSQGSCLSGRFSCTRPPLPAEPNFGAARTSLLV